MVNQFSICCIFLDRKAKDGRAVHQEVILKDQWGQFLVHLFTRKNLEMTCKVLRTQYTRPMFH